MSQWEYLLDGLGHKLRPVHHYEVMSADIGHEAEFMYIVNPGDGFRFRTYVALRGPHTQEPQFTDEEQRYKTLKAAKTAWILRFET